MDFVVSDSARQYLEWLPVCEDLNAVCFHGFSQYNTLKVIGAFRYHVWQTEGFHLSDDCIWIDKYDSVATHWVVCQNNRIVGSARLTIHASIDDVPNTNDFTKLSYYYVPPIASLNRLVVCPTSRGKGIASWLDEQRIEKAHELGANTIIGTVPAKRVKALAILGFVEIGICHDAEFPGMEWHIVSNTGAKKRG